MSGSKDDVYVHGHHESVLRSHAWRTVENSAAYLVPHLAAGLDVLDVGCGPGTITVEMAPLVAPGRIIGMDASTAVIANAKAHLGDTDASNCSFEVGDVYNLAYADDTFDVVHAHQVLQHVTDPVAALSEMRRVTKPNGIVAARDSDYACKAWAPADPRLDRWLEIYHQITAANGVEADAGRYLLGWAQQAGFTAVTTSSSTWTFATPSRRAWWGSLWADRVLHSNYADNALAHNFATQDELEAISAAFEHWATQPDAFFVVVHGEIIATK